MFHNTPFKYQITEVVFTVWEIFVFRSVTGYKSVFFSSITLVFATKRPENYIKLTICAGLSGVKSFQKCSLSIRKTSATSPRAIFHFSPHNVTDSIHLATNLNRNTHKLRLWSMPVTSRDLQNWKHLTNFMLYCVTKTLYSMETWKNDKYVA